MEIKREDLNKIIDCIQIQRVVFGCSMPVISNLGIKEKEETVKAIEKSNDIKIIEFDYLKMGISYYDSLMIGATDHRTSHIPSNNVKKLAMLFKKAIKQLQEKIDNKSNNHNNIPRDPDPTVNIKTERDE